VSDRANTTGDREVADPVFELLPDGRVRFWVDPEAVAIARAAGASPTMTRDAREPTTWLNGKPLYLCG